MKTPVNDALSAYAELNALRMHMPGHMGKGESLKNLAAMAAIDCTEIPGAPDFVRGRGAAGELMDIADEYYGGTTVFSTCGASLCVKAALLLGCGEGGRVLIDRRCHRSVIDAAVLLSLDAEYIYTDENLKKTLPGKLKNGGFKAVVITTPTYYGEIFEIDEIADDVRKSGAKLIADNSHGSHLAAHPMKARLHPLFAGADYCIDSFHKTLPALTGAAALHCREKNKREDALEAMRLFGSSSPSLPVAASAELALCYLIEKAPGDLIKVLGYTREICKMLADTAASAVEFSLRDPLRLCIDYGKSSLCAKEAEGILNANGVYPEFSDDRYLILMFSPLFSAPDCERLKKALVYAVGTDAKRDSDVGLWPRLERKNGLREAYFSASKELPIDSCEGRTAARPLYLFPPGIPVCLPGEIISREFIDRYKNEFKAIKVID